MCESLGRRKTKTNCEVRRVRDWFVIWLVMSGHVEEIGGDMLLFQCSREKDVIIPPPPPPPPNPPHVNNVVRVSTRPTPFSGKSSSNPYLAGSMLIYQRVMVI